MVEQGGPLSNNKGINRKGGGLTAPALTEKDMQDIKTAARLKADYLAVSFPRSGADIQWARDLMIKAGGRSLICAKIERAEAIPALAEILDASDAVMVARGDLAVEVGDAVVPALQKRMIRMARERNKLVITATQMMESMINNPIPTRAEVSDVANAVLDGTDAVMLSAETAAGSYPVETVAAMARVCLEAEKEDTFAIERRRTGAPESVEEAIARATIFTANSLNIKAVAALTQSGKTALLMSRMNSKVPIYALSSVVETRRRVTLFRGVYPIKFKGARNPERALHMAEDELLKRGAVQPRRLHRAHHRRAFRQGRRHQYHENRQGRRAPQSLSAMGSRRRTALEYAICLSARGRQPTIPPNTQIAGDIMFERELAATAAAMVAPGKGILAIDESGGTIKKRFDTIGVESTVENRRAYRDLLITPAGLSQYISGMILYDETLRQATQGRHAVSPKS